MFRNMRTRTAAIVAAAALGLTAVGGTAAWAWYSEATAATASGGANGNMTALVEGTAAYVYDNPSNTLFPGHSATVRIPLTNNNPVPVEIVTVTAGTPTGACAAEITESTGGGVALRDSSDNAVSGFQIPAGATYTLVITNGVTLNNTATGACEGTAFASKWNITAENR